MSMGSHPEKGRKLYKIFDLENEENFKNLC
jgi:hypothetical protein